jgi:hypothetical protein
MRLSSALPCFFLLSLAISAWAQAPKPEPDVVIFTDGERLSGHLVGATATAFTFQSDMLGSITADWTKVRELHSSKAFAVIPKGVDFKRNADTTAIPKGALGVADQKITITPASGAPSTVAVADATNVVEGGAFEKAMTRHTGFFQDWAGGVGGGASFVQATQDSRTFNAGINFVRISPLESWLRRRNRTTLAFTTTYGVVEQPGTTTVKTSIYHAGLERDEYFSTSWYGFGQALYDHNFSQGLNLQQSYGGGLGWSAIQKGGQNLDLKFGVTYDRQQFSVASNDKNLSGSTFEEDYKRSLKHGMVFTQQLIVNPAWNDTNAAAGSFSAQILAPISKKMNFSVGTIDNYLHDPPAGFKRNSTQLNLALNYTIR